MFDFKDVVAVTGIFDGKKFFTVMSESGDIATIYEDNTCYVYRNEDFELLKQKIDRAKFERIYYSHKDYNIELNDAAALSKDKVEDILKKLDFISEVANSEDYTTDSKNAVIKNVDSLGRITIPKNLRRKFNLLDGGAARVYEHDGKIVIEPIES